MSRGRRGVRGRVEGGNKTRGKRRTAGGRWGLCVWNMGFFIPMYGRSTYRTGEPERNTSTNLEEVHRLVYIFSH